MGSQTTNPAKRTASTADLELWTYWCFLNAGLTVGPISRIQYGDRLPVPSTADASLPKRLILNLILYKTLYKIDWRHSLGTFAFGPLGGCHSLTPTAAKAGHNAVCREKALDYADTLYKVELSAVLT